MQARHYSLLAHGTSPKVQCRLCQHFCRLAEGEIGFCGVRQVVNGKLESAVCGGPAAMHTDPIEKKPLYHFLPQSKTFSIGTMGCNFDCAWCQNDNLSRSVTQTGLVQFQPMQAKDVVTQALAGSCKSIAFTYNEPTVFFEYMTECAELAKNAGLARVLVSNGYQSPQVLLELLPLLDAANIDLKSFNPATYKTYCKARLAPVLKNLKTFAASLVHLEVTSLLIPTINDSEQEIRAMARFIANELGPHTPWHLSAFFPCRNMQHVPPTPAQTLRMAAEIAATESLHFVYTGNIPGLSQHTRCPVCHQTLVERNGFHASLNPDFALLQGNCPHCGTPISGVWS